ncbi:MAG: protein phosphatase 2C domain-containing protein [Kofleriaceae bacterium]
MPDVKMHVAALSDVGRARTTNEDAFAITDLASGQRIESSGTQHAIDVGDRGVLLALSDGMGGAQAGEVASALVVDSVQRALARGSRGAIAEQLEEAVQRANKHVFEAANSENRQGMGATVIAIFVRGSDAYIAEVGDSRAYLLRNGRLRQITRDQSLVQLMVDQGILTPAEAKHFPSKNVILQAVGLSPEIRVAIGRLSLRRGDRFLLCSDGVTNAVSDAELLQIITQSDPRAACETMIALANDRGGEDNQTAIVADVIGDALQVADEFESVTETYDVLKAYDPTLKGSAGELDAAASGGRPPPVDESDAIPIASPPPVSGEIESGSNRRAVPEPLQRESATAIEASATRTVAPVGSRKMMVIAVAAAVVVALVIVLVLAS